MTDLEIVKKCAEKMGLKPDGQATKSVAYNVSHCSILAINENGGHTVYDPLHNDAQAMALVRKFSLDIFSPILRKDWVVMYATDIDCRAFNKDLNRAICECVARLP